MELAYIILATAVGGILLIMFGLTTILVALHARRARRRARQNQTKQSSKEGLINGHHVIEAPLLPVLTRPSTSESYFSCCENILEAGRQSFEPERDAEKSSLESPDMSWIYRKYKSASSLNSTITPSEADDRQHVMPYLSPLIIPFHSPSTSYTPSLPTISPGTPTPAYFPSLPSSSVHLPQTPPSSPPPRPDSPDSIYSQPSASSHLHQVVAQSPQLPPPVPPIPQAYILAPPIPIRKVELPPMQRPSSSRRASMGMDTLRSMLTARPASAHGRTSTNPPRKLVKPGRNAMRQSRSVTVFYIDGKSPRIPDPILPHWIVPPHSSAQLAGA